MRSVSRHGRSRCPGSYLSFVTVRITDTNGQTAPTANNAIRFSIDGPAEIVATDNGDPTSFVPFQSRERAAFNGLCLVIVRALPEKTGKITLRAESDSLQGASIALRSAGRR